LLSLPVNNSFSEKADPHRQIGRGGLAESEAARIALRLQPAALSYIRAVFGLYSACIIERNPPAYAGGLFLDRGKPLGYNKAKKAAAHRYGRLLP